MKNPIGEPPADELQATEALIYSKVCELIRLLGKSKKRLVLAESCTGGLAAASFTSFPGVSEVFCGSMVVYRNDTKSRWLGVDPQMLSDQSIGPVSPQASESLALEVLEKTPEADIAIGITGHLGPNAPNHLNRKIFLAYVQRQGNLITKQCVLDSPPIGTETANIWMIRRCLQAQATERLLDFALGILTECNYS